MPEPAAQQPDLPIDSVELQEYLFSCTDILKCDNAAGGIGSESRKAELQVHLRRGYRLHRFMVMNWLMMNGVKIPVQLLDDRNHPEPGLQMPDKAKP